MSTITVTYVAGTRFDVHVRDHAFTVDQPVADGGDDAGPTPTELFAAALTACVAHYARGYLVRHGLPTEGLGASASFSMTGRPTRFADIQVTLAVPAGVPAEHRPRLLAVASACTIHNSLEHPPAVTVTLGTAAASSAA
jgi:uncharacterized OsmC-like protein